MSDVTAFGKRQERARALGWKSYGERRRALAFLKNDPEIRRRYDRARGDVPPDASLHDEALYAAWWRAHFGSESHRRDAESPRAFWYVKVTGKPQSFDRDAEYNRY